MLQKDDEKRLTEVDCLTSSRQYDPQIIFHVNVPRRGYHTIDCSAFVRCSALHVLDLSGNKLSTLSGMESVAPQLTFLNAAENSLHDIRALATCAALEQCMLEGNKLPSFASLEPLVTLPCLNTLVLQRRVLLQSGDTGLGGSHQSSDKLLLLDNPVCRDAVAYKEHFLAKVPHVRWVDGVSAYLRARILAEGNAKESDEGTANSATAIVDAAVRSFQSLGMEMTALLDEEATLRRQLEHAVARCKPSTATAATLAP
ncbi:hypothetical protein LSCM1_00612 [Leishmania martiniquensis]|uniref:Leucine-rich repeat protein (LRRP) n=1 Tax=Leishmania martiniquensis TaxID=1580590 RepID=A0A836GSY9_9TRYP|nr:hypothetical protein LSCM1_00612 [Leishmania martiniquensis]